MYRCEGGIEGNQKLAQRAFEGLADDTPLAMYGKTYKPQRQPDGTFMVVLTLIETRGTGGLFLCAPTPGYVLIQGTFEQIPTITAAERTHLLQVARSLTEWHPEAPGTSTPTQTTQNTGEKPGDAYNARGDVPGAAAETWLDAGGR